MKNTINFIKINLISSNLIQKWASRLNTFNKIIYGEITSPFFFKQNFYSIYFEPKGLFSEQIFGPTSDFSCFCERFMYALPRTPEFLFEDCSECHTTLTFSFVRQYRMAYIPLILPIIHTWFLWSTINFFNLLFNLPNNLIKQYIYFDISKKNYKILNDSIETIELLKKTRVYSQRKKEEIKKTIKYLEKVINTLQKKNLQTQNNINIFSLTSEQTIIEKIFNLIENFDLKTEIEITFKNINLLIKEKIPQKLKFFIKKFRYLENFILAQIKPQSIFLKKIPVMPPDFRPFTDESDAEDNFFVNSIYQNIIKKNNILIFLLNKEEKITNRKFLIVNELRALQESIDFLIDHLKLKAHETLNKHPIKSLSSIIRGKFGRFRSTIFGKRVNFSARSVIIVNSQLKLNQCGIPFNILKILFSDFIKNIISANDELSDLNNHFLQYKIIKNLLYSKTILLNRAPTLHRFGIQAFNPIIIGGNAIQIHPLVCASYNADFDGDQMSIHLPLTKLSEIEIKKMLKATDSLYTFLDKKIKSRLSQDLILGLVYLTLRKQDNFQKIHYFDTFNDVLNCFLLKKITSQTPVWFKINKTINKNYIRTTAGRLLLTKILLKKKNDFN